MNELAKIVNKIWYFLLYSKVYAVPNPTRNKKNFFFELPFFQKSTICYPIPARKPDFSILLKYYGNIIEWFRVESLKSDFFECQFYWKIMERLWKDSWKDYFDSNSFFEIVFFFLQKIFKSNGNIMERFMETLMETLKKFENFHQKSSIFP